MPRYLNNWLPILATWLSRSLGHLGYLAILVTLPVWISWQLTIWLLEYLTTWLLEYLAIYLFWIILIIWLIGYLVD